MFKPVALAAILGVLAAPAQAGKPFDIHGLIVGSEGARYVKGVPTLDLPLQRGAIQLRSFGFLNNRPVFAIAFYNAGPEPVNIGREDIRVSSNGAPLRVFSVEELEGQAKQKAWWTKFGLAMLGGLAAGAAASARDSYSSTLTSPYGTYRWHASYPSLYGQLQADRITTNTAFGLAAIQYQLDATLERLNNHVVQRTTVDPGQSYAGLIVLDKLKKGDPPFELRLDVEWNGERYPFAYLLQRPGRAIPDKYAAMLAVHAKPKAFAARFDPKTGEQIAVSLPTAAPRGAVAASRETATGAIVLASGVVKIPAKTRSGYCLKTPYGYNGTGAIDSPAITGALPRCLDDSGRVPKQDDSPLRRN